MGSNETEIAVTYLDRDALAIDVRGHRVVVDQPTDAGGEDLGPTPTELFVASLAACIGFYAERYLRRHDLPTDGLAVRTSFRFGEGRPSRVASMALRLVLPAPIPAERMEALRRVVDHCTVHESIRNEPDIRIEIEEAGAADAA
jgi:putative redox protein